MSRRGCRPRGCDAPDPGSVFDSTSCEVKAMECQGVPACGGRNGGAANVTRVGRDGRRTVVWLSGEQDADTSSFVRTALDDVVAAADGDVVVDLTEVGFLAAATLGDLVRCRQLLAAQCRRLTVRGLRGGPLRVLEMGGLVDLVESPHSDAEPDGSGAAGARPARTSSQVAASPSPL